MRSGGGAVLVLGGAAVGLAVALFLRTRMPRAAVVGLVAMAGAALGAGGLLIEGDPAPLDWALTPSLLALSLPVHARIALGPLGGGGADGDPSASSERGHELLEHTADIGIRAWGRRLEDAFEEAAVALADILGARAEAAAETRRLRATGQDHGALLVDFLDALVFLHESDGVALGDARVVALSETALEADVDVAPLPGEPTGTPVKGATYHRLLVKREQGPAEIRVYLDV